MESARPLDREEYIEQAYFFRVLRERLAANLPVQEVLSRIDEEILSTTRLPYAIQFLATEVKHTGLLSSGFARLPHYFTAFQAFVIRQTEQEHMRFSADVALLLLEREAQYLAQEPTAAGLFIYQFEAISRNRLGYEEGLKAMTLDPFFDADWRAYVEFVDHQGGTVDFADLVYLRSDLYVLERRRQEADYVPPLPALFREKEGKIAKASHGRDPLYLFAALQRQLGYPEVPRPRAPDDTNARLLALNAKMRELETRLKLLESESRNQVDLSQFMQQPELLSGPSEEQS